MKKSTIIIISIASVIIIGSAFIINMVINHNKSPSETVAAYYEAAMNGEVDQAKEYVSQEVIEVYENGGTWFSNSLKAAIIKEGQSYSSVEPVEGSETIKGKMATVEVKLIDPQGNETIDNYNLIKEGSEWKMIFQ